MTDTGFYEGLIGSVYAAAISGQRFAEDEVFTRLVAETGGTALELGCGTGRLLLRLLSAGHDVHGLEISDAMTQICLAGAARLGLRPVVHPGSFAPLDSTLRGYAAMYCPLNAFSFIVDDSLALESVRSYVAALEPGGLLALAGSAGDDTLSAQTDWVRRPDVLLPDSLVAHIEERRVPEPDGRCLKVERTIEVAGHDGRVRAAERGIQMRRLRPIAELAEMFAQANLAELHAYGSDADYILTGRKG